MRGKSEGYERGGSSLLADLAVAQEKRTMLEPQNWEPIGCDVETVLVGMMSCDWEKLSVTSVTLWPLLSVISLQPVKKAER